MAASGGRSLLPGLAPSGQGHVHTHTPWAAWSVMALTHPHGCGLSPHGRSPEYLRRWCTGAVAVAQLLLLLRVPVPGRHTCSLCFFQAGEKHYHPLCALCASASLGWVGAAPVPGASPSDPEPLRLMPNPADELGDGNCPPAFC